MPTSYMNEHNTRIWTFIRVGEWRYFSWYHKVFLFVFNYHIDSFIIAFLSHTSSSWKGFFRWEQTEIVLNCFPGITWLLTTNSRVNHLGKPAHHETSVVWRKNICSTDLFKDLAGITITFCSFAHLSIYFSFPLKPLSSSVTKNSIRSVNNAIDCKSVWNAR